MDLGTLISELSRPEAYPHPVEDVEVIQTHISVVFLAGAYVYKVKKPVEMGFLDFTTLARRLHFCREEVRLNRRTAPGVYLGVLPVCRDGGGLRFGGECEAVEYAVHMQRLPPERTLKQILARGELDDRMMTLLGRRIAGFHAQAESGTHLAKWGAWDAVAFNVRENFEQLSPYVGRSVTREVYERLAAASEQGLASLRPLISGRADDGVTCDTHGDLHLEHIYSFPDREPPDDLVVVDCIEFNERFRYTDPVADVAFLVMDLKRHDKRSLALRLADAYFEAAGDTDGRQLLPFYTAYRAVVRGKVESFTLDQSTVIEPERRMALGRARAQLLLALGELVPAAERPCLVLACGLPGTGKSWLARGLVAEGGFTRVSTDLTRKALAGVPHGREGETVLDERYYDAAWNDRTYQACLKRATELLLEGRRVVVDGTLSQAAWRARFTDLASELAVPALLLICEAEPDEVRSRLDGRTSDPSDATWEVYLKLQARWESLTAAETGRARVVDTMTSPDGTIRRALAALRSEGLA